MSKVEQSAGKAVATKKNKVDADLLDPGSETPIERMDIVLPGAEEQAAPATNANEKPLDSSADSSAPSPTDTNPQDVQTAGSSSNSNTDTSNDVAQSSSSSTGQNGSVQIENAPSIDGVDLNANDGGESTPSASENGGTRTEQDAPDPDQQQTSASSANTSTSSDTASETNVAPVDITYTNDIIAENSAGGTVIATLSTVDANINDEHTYAIVNDPSGFFEIIGDEIRVKAGADLDFEAAPTHEITIQVTDSAGNTFTETMTIDLTDVNEHDVSSISDLDAAASAISENASNGDSVGITASAFDADGTNNNVTYSLADDASGMFTIDANTGEVFLADASGLDYENVNSYTIEVTATSEDGSTSTQNFTIDVTDVDEFDVSAITDTNASTNSVDENATAGTTVGIVASATDADGTNSDVTYSLSDDAGGLFTIDTTTGEVTTTAPLDAETASSYDIEVTATSADGSTSTETFSINVSDIDEFDVGAVSDSNSTTNGVDEDASVGDTVGITALASDGDATDGVTYSLSDDAGGLFDIDASTGVVTVAGSLDAETSTAHTIEVTATSDDGSTSTQTFAIGVNDVNETSITAISDTDASGNSVTEGASVGTAVGITAFASDADATDTISYSLSSNPGDFFAIDANTGEVTFAGSLDYETDTSHTIEVTATSTDGTTSTQTFTIAVGDEDEHDVGAISDTDTSANTIAEDVSNGDSVGITASATDADGTNNTVTYSLSDDAGGIFEIDASTGEVSIADASGIDYENATSHTIEVTATSEDGSTSTQNYTINVTDVDEFDVSAIADTDSAANTIAENVSNGDSVGITASATDADGSNNTVTYTLSDDAGGIFEIDASTGEVSIADASSIDYENATSHTIEVTATSADGSTSTQSYTINVTDVDEFDVGAVTDTDSTANTIAENASAGDEVGVTASATDADATNNTVTYSVNDARFEVASDGTVTVASGASFDAETEGSIDIEVTATSADGSTSTETFSINVSDIDEFDVGAVSDSNSTTNGVDEDASVGDTVGITALASDGDATDGVTYSLSDDAGGLFDIDASTGVVTVAGSLDAETDTSHTIEVTATSDDGSTSTQTFAIGVNDVNETSITAISDTDGSGNSVTEGASIGTAVGITAFASDADATDTVSYSLSSNPGDFFAIDANTGEVTVAGSLDYETDTSHTIEVTATSSDGTTSTQTFTIAVGDEDEHDVGAISDTDTSANTIAEDVSNGDSVGITASATDADGTNNTVTYSLSDDAGGIFEIDASTGEVSIADASGIDYETATSHTIEVTATSADGSTSTQSYTINVTDVDEFDVSAIADTDSAANTIAEDVSNGDSVGITASATDADGSNNTVTYTLSDDAGGIFEIDASTGEVSIADASGIDYETATSHTIEVTATSADGSTSTQSYTINVTDVDEFDVGAVTDTDSTANTIAENASAGDEVGVTASASDADGTNNTVTYSVDDARFEVASDGTVTVASGASFDAETEGSIDIEVTATSADGSTSTETFSINVSDIDEFDVGAVSDSNSTTNAVDEDASVGDTVGITALASDGDATDGVTYSLSDDAGGLFDIDASTGVVTVAGSLDAETDTSHTIEVTATSDDGSTSTQTFAIGVNDVNETSITAISDTDSSGNSVTEGASVGTAVGITALASDADATDTISYSLSSNPGDFFAIDANTGEVTVAGSLDYETDTSHTIEVTATSTDGTTSTQTFTIAVGDEDEHDVGAISDTDTSANTIAEDVSNGDSVGITASATDADGTNNTVTYSLSDDAGGIFEIDASTGEVSIADASGIDYENATSHTIEVTATSEDGSTSTQSYAINVTDVDEFDVSAITDTDASANSVDENAAAGTTVGIVASASDADATNSDVTYSLSDDAGGLFTIDATTGEVTTTAPLDAETASSYDIEVTATSEDGSTSTTTFTVDVNNLMDEGPTDITFTGGTVNETVLDGGTIDSAYDPSGSTVVTLSATDADSGDTFTYAITNDPSGHFEIVGNEVRVKSGQDIDYETAQSHDITIEVTDAGGNTYSETITINVQDFEGAYTATSAGETITGTREEDVIDAHADGSTIDGGWGSDTINGSASDDDITGNRGHDTINAGDGNDVIDGGDGDDLIYGGDGDDIIEAGEEINFGDDDIIYGGAGNDTITSVETDSGSNDTFYGEAGDDTIISQGGADILDGGTGDDRLSGGTGNDTIDGGDDTDTAVYSGIWSDYTITESGGTYTIVDNRSGSPDGTDTVTNVESFEFADGTVGVADLLDVGPSDIDVSSNSVDENSASGTVVASLSATDNALDSHTYSITNDPSGFFEISGDQVLVKAGAALDTENAPMHDITVEVTDANGNTYSETITINVADVDEFDVGAVTDTDSAANTIAENASAGDEVGVTASASDADGTNNTVTYSVDDARFEVASDGTVTVASGASFDAETEGSIDIEVTATSADGSTSTETFSINVSDIDEFDVGAVSDSNSTTNGVDEDASVGDTVGITALASDGDVTDGVTYSLSDDAGGLFDIDASTGVVTVAGSLDAETDTSHTIEVTATSDDGSTSTQTFAIGVNDVNETSITAISDTDGSGNSVTEGASIGTAVGITAFASDADATDTVSYSLSSNPGDFFAIDANTGEVTVAGSLDYETDTSHTIEVTATSSDGTTSTQTFTIAVGDENEGPTDISFTGGSVDETVSSGGTIGTANDPSGSTVATLSATDEDAGETFTYAITNDPSGHFEIVGNEVRVKSNQEIDYEAAQSHDITIEVTDAGGNTYTETITINVQDYEGSASGTSGHEYFQGTSEEDQIKAGEGHDTILGGDGDDSISAGDGNDAIIGGAGADAIDGGDGEDTARYDGSSSGVSVDLSSGTGSGGDAEGDTLKNVENLQGSSYSDKLAGDAGENTIYGMSGDDYISGGDGADTLDGGSGADEIDGGAGADTIYGGSGDDTLDGGADNDVLQGDSGNDIIDGGDGEDTAVYTGNWADYTITESAGTYKIVDNRPGSPDGTDTVTNVEDFEFADGTVAVADLLNVGPSDIDVSSSSVDENSSAGTVVATLSTTDNALDTHTYSITKDPSGLFEISGDQIVVKAGADIDYENATSHDILVEVIDAAGKTYSETITINVTDVDEFDVGAVTDTDSTANTIAENASAGDEVGVTASASDADGTNNAVTYSVDDARFEVASDGTVTVASGASFDAETEGSIDIEVTATSADGSTSTETFSINVSDIDEFDVGAVSDSNASSNAVDEDASVGDTVGITALASDDDATDGVTYSLSDDAGGLFDIDASTGVVTVAGSLDAETDTSHTIEVTATSDDGSTSTQTFAIGVNDVNETSITAISDTDGSGNSVTEGASIGTAVGITAFASDADATDTVSYSLSSNPGDFFAIDANTGEVTVAGSLDYETDTSHTIEVTATSTDGTTSTQTFTIAVGDEDEHDVGAISDTDTSANTIAEDVSNGDSVGITASATDADGTNNTVTYSLSDDAGGIFEIDASTGEVSIADASGIDYETATSHSIEVTATSADGSTSTQTMTVNVSDVVDENPTDIQLTGTSGNLIQNGSFEEFSVSAGGVRTFSTDSSGAWETDTTMEVWDSYGSVSATDGSQHIELDSGSAVDSISQTISTTNGQVYDMSIDVMERSGSSSSDTVEIYWNGELVTTVDPGTSWETVDFQVIGTGGNDVFEMREPSSENNRVGALIDNVVMEEVPLTIAEGVDGAVIGTLTTTDADTSDSHTYTISDARFEVVDDGAGNMQLKLKAGESFNYETETSVDITVTTTDAAGNNYNEDFTITVADVSDLNPTDLTLDANENLVVDASSETIAAGSIIGSVDNVVDVDTNETFTFALTDDAGGKFEIDADTGEIKLVAEHDASSAYSDTVDVLVTDAGGNTYTETVGIQLGTEDGETLTGTANSDIMHGFGGQDTLNGGDGDDVLVASDGTAGAVEELTLNDTSTDGVASVSNLFSVDLDEISYEVNLTVDNIPSGGANIVSYATMDGSSEHDNEFTIMLNSDGSLLIIINETSHVNTGPLATDLTDGSEHRLSVTWDNTDGSVKVYVDGAEEYSVTGVATNNMIDGGGTLTLGQEQDSVGGSYDTNQIFSGTMDDVRIFNDVRSATEIADNHDSQLANPSSESNLVANWQFDGESGTTVTDLANHYDLTLSGDASLEEGAVVGDTLNGGDGDDIMISATGSDTIDGGAGTDTASYEGSDSAVNVNLNSDVLSGGDAEGDTLTSIENVTGSDHDDTLTGDYAANTLVGGDGNDTLDGLSGKDTLDGGAGDDILMAGFDDGTGDIFIGGEGNDTYQIEGSTVENYGFNVDLNTGSDQYNNSYSGIENINGGNGNDTFTGDANANIFSGGGGSDTMYGGDESDIFVFGEGDGADTVHGGAGGGWTDTIELTDAGGDLGTYGTDWTVSLTSGSIDAQDANSLTLSDDADGTITLADGSTVDFYEIERIEF